MKKHILTLTIILITATATLAQSNSGVGGVRRGGTSLELKEDTKERLKAELKINDSQKDSVAAIEHSYQFKMRALKTDTHSDEQVKKEKIAELDAERKQKLKAVLTDEQIAQLDVFMQNRKKMSTEKRSGQRIE